MTMKEKRKQLKAKVERARLMSRPEWMQGRQRKSNGPAPKGNQPIAMTRTIK